jgi:hypothetical protein
VPVTVEVDGRIDGAVMAVTADRIPLTGSVKQMRINHDHAAPAVFEGALNHAGSVFAVGVPGSGRAPARR